MWPYTDIGKISLDIGILYRHIHNMNCGYWQVVEWFNNIRKVCNVWFCICLCIHLLYGHLFIFYCAHWYVVFGLLYTFILYMYTCIYICKHIYIYISWHLQRARKKSTVCARFIIAEQSTPLYSQLMQLSTLQTTITLYTYNIRTEYTLGLWHIGFTVWIVF